MKLVQEKPVVEDVKVVTSDELLTWLRVSKLLIKAVAKNSGATDKGMRVAVAVDEYGWTSFIADVDVLDMDNNILAVDNAWFSEASDRRGLALMLERINSLTSANFPEIEEEDDYNPYDYNPYDYDDKTEVDGIRAGYKVVATRNITVEDLFGQFAGGDDPKRVIVPEGAIGVVLGVDSNEDHLHRIEVQFDRFNTPTVRYGNKNNNLKYSSEYLENIGCDCDFCRGERLANAKRLAATE